MFNFLSKYKLQSDILAVLVWCYIAVDKIFFEQSQDKKNFSLFFGIVAALLMIFKIGYVIDDLRKRRLNSATCRPADATKDDRSTGDDKIKK